MATENLFPVRACFELDLTDPSEKKASCSCCQSRPARVKFPTSNNTKPPSEHLRDARKSASKIIQDVQAKKEWHMGPTRYVVYEGRNLDFSGIVGAYLDAHVTRHRAALAQHRQMHDNKPTQRRRGQTLLTRYGSSEGADSPPPAKFALIPQSPQVAVAIAAPMPASDAHDASNGVGASHASQQQEERPGKESRRWPDPFVTSNGTAIFPSLQRPRPEPVDFSGPPTPAELDEVPGHWHGHETDPRKIEAIMANRVREVERSLREDFRRQKREREQPWYKKTKRSMARLFLTCIQAAG